MKRISLNTHHLLVSAQRVGVDRLKTWSPERYGRDADEVTLQSIQTLPVNKRKGLSP